MPRRKIRPNLDVDITWDDVQNKPSTFPPSSHNHDERYYTETELQTSGQSQVHWDNVSNKPSLITGSGTTDTIPKFTGTNAIGDSSIIDSTNITFSKNVDFAKYKAIAMACDNGSTLPTSPVIGQWFLHTPTGRKVLMMYGGSSWIPIISLGSMTLYVDDVNGTDSQDRGFGTGTNAFKTIQYAINQIPGQYSGDVTINIASGTYGGFILRGKYPTGDYYIYINGTLQTDYTGTITSGTIGSAENYCTITVSGAGWTPNQWVGYIAEWNNQYSVIMSNTSNTLTVVGKSTVTPSGTLNIKSQAVTLSSAAIIYSDNVYLQNLYANNATMYFDNARNCFIMFCKIRCNTHRRIGLQNYAQVGIYYTYVFSDSTAVYSTTDIDASMIFNVYASYWNTSTGSATRGIRVMNGSQFNSNGGIFAVNGFYTGIQGVITAVLSFYTGTGMKNRITNCTYGIYMTRGSHIGASSNLYYSGNTTNYYAEAASYAYYG
jgi:hypothetical protein